MIDPQRELLRGGGRPGRNSFRADIAFSIREIREDPYRCAVEVSPRRSNQTRVGGTSEILDTRSDASVAAIPDNSAASIEAFVRANVKIGRRCSPTGTDRILAHRLSTRPADGRQDGWPYRAPDPSSLALMKRWGLGTYQEGAASTSTPISTSLSSVQSALLPARLVRNHARSPRTTTRRVTGISSGAIIPAQACRQSGASRGAAGQRPACGQTDQDLPKKSNPALFRI
jgi:hypothetical protein